VSCGQGVATNGMHERPRENKANLGGVAGLRCVGAGPCACPVLGQPQGVALKQGHARCNLRLQTRPQAACAKQTQFSGHGRDGRGTHGRNARATERLAASPRLRGDDIATNRVSAPNKPNFGPGKVKGKCCANRELRQVGCENGPGKTKPISRLRIADFGLRIGGRTCRLRPAQGGSAKQTQFSGHGRSRPWYSWARRLVVLHISGW
jgi:hypothetical protein